jgi:hypothetical protein
VELNVTRQIQSAGDQRCPHQDLADPAELCVRGIPERSDSRSAGANGRPAYFSEGTDTRKHTLCRSDHNKAPILAPVLFLKCEHKKSYIPIRNNGLNTEQPQGVKSNTKDGAI